MNIDSLKQRLLAGLVHLLASLLVAAAVAALIFLVWYPPPLAETQGVSRLLLILIAVDVTIGPLITTLVFDRRKKSLKFDLAVVMLLQLGFLLYGLHSIYGGRPALIVFNIDRFDVVAAGAMDLDGLRVAQEQGKPGLPWMRPRIVGALLPTDPQERTELMFSSGRGGSDLPQLAQYHVPYEEVRSQVLGRMQDLAELKDLNHLDEPAWQALLKSLQLPEAGLAYLPLKGKVQDGVVVVNRQTAEVIRILLLAPEWHRPAAPDKPQPATPELG